MKQKTGKKSRTPLQPKPEGRWIKEFD